ncbi:MAG: 30S ribosomal protein S7 [Christensenellaceae bacterium]|jgi:small subunit ribosomal protein S7|nr:30S ribosomal protein S7 [Christensenellaceae bacterium]
MPRRSGVPVKPVLADPIYKSKTITKLINQVMLDGKKSIAQKIVYGALEQLSKKVSAEPLTAFMQALENVMPLLETKARRVGGSNYQVPMEVRPARRQTLGIRWIVDNARKRSEKTMEERLFGELLDAFNGTGGAFKKKEEMHRMAEANKAFAHYKW